MRKPRLKRRPKTNWKARALLFSTIALVAGFALGHMFTPQEQPVEEVLSEPAPEVVETMAFCGVSKKSIVLSKKNRDSYSKKHRPAATKLKDAKHVKNKKQLDDLIRENKLLTVIEGLGFIISYHKLEYSHPVLHPKALTALEELGSAFAKKLSGTPEQGSVFTISSLTRTHAQQLALRKINKSATRKASTHSYGASFEIWGIMSPSGHCKNALEPLGDALVELRKQKKIFLLPESSCIHVTVR